MGPPLQSRTLALIALAALAVAALPVFSAHELLLYNPSSSISPGFYLRTAEEPRHGAVVTVRASDVAPAYARARDFTDPGDRFLKRIAAVAGDVVCAHENAMVVNQRPLPRQTRDAAGRALPLWQGCRALLPGEVLLLGDTEASFDGRYWGPVSERLIEGVWRPL